MDMQGRSMCLYIHLIRLKGLKKTRNFDILVLHVHIFDQIHVYPKVFCFPTAICFILNVRSEQRTIFMCFRSANMFFFGVWTRGKCAIRWVVVWLCVFSRLWDGDFRIINCCMTWRLCASWDNRSITHRRIYLMGVFVYSNLSRWACNLWFGETKTQLTLYTK